MPLLQRGVRIVAGRMPKIIGPSTHAVIDYAFAGSLLLAGALLWKRNKRAAFGAFVCGGAAAANNLLTDYPGGVTELISYRDHGRIDTALTGLTATMPRLMDFDGEPEARFFGAKALADTLVIGLTNFDYYEKRSQVHQPSRHG